MNDPPDSEPPDRGRVPSPIEYVTIPMANSPPLGVLDEEYQSKGKKRTKNAKKQRRDNSCSNASASSSSYSSLETVESVVIQAGQRSQTVNDNILSVSIDVPENFPPSPDTLPTQTPQILSQGTEARRLYGLGDKGPFVVHVSRIEESPNSGTVLNPVSFGRLLNFLRCKNIIDGSLARIGRNRVSMAFSTYQAANIFTLNEELKNRGYNIFIPSFSVTKMGLIKEVPIEFTNEDIVEFVKVPLLNGCGKVIKARRLNRKITIEGNTQWKPSQTVVLTFDGQILPKKVFFCFNSLEVEPYIYPTIQCFACCRFGHTKDKCRSKPRCFRCGDDHFGDSCTVKENDVRCVNCTGAHSANSNTCPELARQKNIKKIMSDSSMSYAEASKKVPSTKISYADILCSSPSRTSYKKTINITRKPRVMSPSKGYDKVAHAEIIRCPPSTSDNGCALNFDNIDFNKADDTKTLITTLINLLSSLISTPSNVALNNKNSTINNNQPTHNGSNKKDSYTMELPINQ